MVGGAGSPGNMEQGEGRELGVSLLKEYFYQRYSEVETRTSILLKSLFLKRYTTKAWKEDSHNARSLPFLRKKAEAKIIILLQTLVL